MGFHGGRGGCIKGLNSVKLNLDLTNVINLLYNEFMLKDKSLTIFVAVISKVQMRAISNLAKLRGFSKSKALREILDAAIKSFKLK